MTIVKNVTTWINPNGEGYITTIGNLDIVVNLNNLPIVDNVSKKPLITTPTQSSQKYVTIWTGSGT